MVELIVYGPNPAQGFGAWVMSFFRWQDIGELGIWRYQQNSVTGQRRAVRLSGCYGPVHSQWLQGGSWEQKLPSPPSSYRVSVNLREKPHPNQYAGLSYEQASRKAIEICREAVETGRTINASYHLDECRKVMEVAQGH